MCLFLVLLRFLWSSPPIFSSSGGENRKRKREGELERDCFEFLISHFASYTLHNVNKSYRDMDFFAKCILTRQMLAEGYYKIRLYVSLRQQIIFVSVGNCENTNTKTYYLWPCDEPNQPSSVCDKQRLGSNQTQYAVGL